MKDQSVNCDNCHHNISFQQQEGTTYFITFRLISSSSTETVKYNEKESLKYVPSLPLTSGTLPNRYYELLDKRSNEAIHLKSPEIADLVAEAIQNQHTDNYNLIAYCIMPDHVHLIFHINNNDQFQLWQNSASTEVVANILDSLKSHSTIRSQNTNGSHSDHWQHESFDRILHDKKEIERVISFVLHNPVKAGYVDNWQEWRWSYVTDKLRHVI